MFSLHLHCPCHCSSIEDRLKMKRSHSTEVYHTSVCTSSPAWPEGISRQSHWKCAISETCTMLRIRGAVGVCVGGGMRTNSDVKGHGETSRYVLCSLSETEQTGQRAACLSCPSSNTCACFSTDLSLSLFNRQVGTWVESSCLKLAE